MCNMLIECYIIYFRSDSAILTPVKKYLSLRSIHMYVKVLDSGPQVFQIYFLCGKQRKDEISIENDRFL